MDKLTTIVVIGSTGHFGGRICRRLIGEPYTRLVVSSRNQRRAEAFATTLAPVETGQQLSAVGLDQESQDFEAQLRALNPDIVIHTAGPYQEQDYRVARACIACGSHYIDLADGRDFVAGFNCLRAAASDANILAVTGASTLPGLSSAVIESLAHRFSSLSAIRISIAPAHQTPRGPGTIAAVMSYCGKPFLVLESGQQVQRFGWSNLRIQRYPKLGTRLSGACDVPDLTLLPRRYADLQTVTFHAALEAWWEQLALWAMSWGTRLRLVKNWNTLLPWFNKTSQRLIRLGSDQGGMHISLAGLDKQGIEKTLNWHLIARQNHGPEIPCTPALVLTRKLVRNQISARGAFPCTGLMSLPEFDAEVSGFDIHWEVQGD